MGHNGRRSALTTALTRVMTALNAHHRVCGLGEQVDDLTLALITPLGPDYDNVLTHNLALCSHATQHHRKITGAERAIVLCEIFCEKKKKPV